MAGPVRENGRAEGYRGGLAIIGDGNASTGSDFFRRRRAPSPSIPLPPAASRGRGEREEELKAGWVEGNVGLRANCSAASRVESARGREREAKLKDGWVVGSAGRADELVLCRTRDECGTRPGEREQAEGWLGCGHVGLRGRTGPGPHVRRVGTRAGRARSEMAGGRGTSGRGQGDLMSSAGQKLERRCEGCGANEEVVGIEGGDGQ